MSTAAIDPDALAPVAVACDDARLTVTLVGGAAVNTRLAWYPRLVAATPAKRHTVELLAFAVHWPNIDEDMSIKGMLRRRKLRGAA